MHLCFQDPPPLAEERILCRLALLNAMGYSHKITKGRWYFAT